MKFNFNITRIRFRVGNGQRGESRTVGICIPWGKGALNGETSSFQNKDQLLCGARLRKLFSCSAAVFRPKLLQLGELRQSSYFLCQHRLLWSAWAFVAPSD